MARSSREREYDVNVLIKYLRDKIIVREKKREEKEEQRGMKRVGRRKKSLKMY